MADARLVLHPLFAGLDGEAVDRALDRLRLSRHDLRRGEIHLVQGQEYRALSLLVAGSVTATIEDMSGRNLLIETLAAPDVFAAPVLYSSRPRIPVTLSAASPVTIWSIPRDDLDRFCDRFPSVYRNLLEDAGEKFAFLTTRLRLLQFATLRHKIAGYLLALLREQEGATSVGSGQPVVVTPSYSRERLAELFGVARPSLSRTLGELAREGLIRLSGSSVEIPDARRLAHLLQDRGSSLRDAGAGSCAS